MDKNLEMIYGKNMLFVAQHLIDRLNTEGYLSISNDTLANILKSECGVHKAECFVITEGLSTHFILNIEGATKLKDILIKQQDNEYLHNPCRKPMNRIAVKQLDVVIQHLEGVLC